MAATNEDWSLGVARRAQCVLALLVRQQVEEQFAQRGAMPGVLDRLARWLQSESLADSLDDEEAALLAMHVGSWTAEDVTAAAWRIERLACLLWALGRIEISASPVVVDTPAVWSAIPLMGATAELPQQTRAPREIDHARRAILVWKWRLEVELQRRAGITPKSGEPFETMISRAAARAAGLVDADEMDLLIRETRVTEISELRLRESVSVVLEREAAFAALTPLVAN